MRKRIASAQFWLAAVIVVVATSAGTAGLVTAQTPTPAQVPTWEQYNEVAARVQALEAERANTAREIIPREIIIRDPSIYALDDNVNGDTPAYIPDCLSNQVGGSRYVDQIYDLSLGDGCILGARIPARVIINWDERNPPQLDLRRHNCVTASCGMGYGPQWAAKNSVRNPVRFAATRAVLQDAEVNGSFPVYVQTWVTNTDGQMRWSTSQNPNGGITLHPGGEPVCELAGLSNAEQGATPWWDFANSRLMVQLPKTAPNGACTSVQVWPSVIPGLPSAPALADPNSVPIVFPPELATPE